MDGGPIITRVKNFIFLCVIFAIALAYRILILFHGSYPPSADIGLHGSVINLILQEGKIQLWNPYHMGGGPYPIPPGYHIFTSIVVFFTGIPLYIAEPLVSSLFSSFIIFPAYLISKKVWESDSLALLSAFILILSSLSIEMLCWGAYANISALALFAMVAYLILEGFDSRNWGYAVLAGMLMGCTIFSHLFSSFVFFVILFTYATVFLICRFLGFSLGKSPNILRFFFLSVVLGLLVALPWLLLIFDFYAEIFVSGTLLSGTEESRVLILLLRRVDADALLLVALLSLLSLVTFKLTKGKWIDNYGLFIVTWFFVPVALTQLHLIGIVVDYIRFVYFADFPGHLMLAAAVYCLATDPLSITKKLSAFTTSIHVQTLLHRLPLTVLVMILLVIVTGFSPASVSPQQSITKANFYTTMRTPEFDAMSWIRQKTSISSILVSDHLYGWWLSGFTQRPTLSAVPLQYLLYPLEIERAKAARFLLNTDYLIDNGLIQIAEDGGYFARYNPIFFIKTKKQYPFSLLHFNESETTIFVQRKNVRRTVDLFELSMVKARWVSKSEKMAALTMTRENDFLEVEKTLKVHRGVRFADLSYEIRTKDSETIIEWVRFIPHIIEGKQLIKQSMFGLYDVNEKVCGQVIFKEQHPKVKIYTTERVSSAEFLYTTEDVHSIRITFLVGVFDAEDMEYEEVLERFEELLKNPKKIVSDHPITAWDYLEMINIHNVSFVVIRDKEIYPKFSNDPNFQAVYNNGKVAIFKVARCR